MSELKLHEVSKSLNKLNDLLEEGVDVSGFLDAVDMQLQDKAKNLFFFMQNYKNNNASIDTEIKRLQALKKTYTGNFNKLKSYIGYSMGANNITQIETDLVKFSFRKSSAVEIEDETKLPKKYFKEKVSVSVDKVSLGKDLKAGEKVPGAFMKEKANLQIK